MHCANLQMFEFTNVHDGANVYNGTLYIVQSSRMRVSGAECEDLLGAVKGNFWLGLWSHRQHRAGPHLLYQIFAILCLQNLFGFWVLLSFGGYGYLTVVGS